MDRKEKISLLRSAFEKHNIDAYMIPSFDEFQNEYVPENLQRLKWLTDFTGSNGLALITKEQNFLFTDGRYTAQAEKQLAGEDFKVCDFKDFKEIESGLTVGYDPLIFTPKFLEHLGHHNLIPLNSNLVDDIWERSKEFKTKAALVLDAKYTARSEISKVNNLVAELKTDYMLLTSPESICWLLNMRGEDVTYSPLIMCYCLVDTNGVVEVFSGLNAIKCEYKNIKLSSFAQIQTRILELNQQNKTIECDASKTPIWFIQNYQKENIVFKQDPCMLPKARKDAIEIAGFQYATIQDGVALTNLFCWLEESVASGDEVSEIDVDQKLLELKQKRPLFKTKSFETISGFAQNSAIIHYNPYVGENSTIVSDNFYLLDCGSQYSCGTTDVTRTFFFGEPQEDAKLHYTLVLKGFINLSNLKFPIGTTGAQIDAVARQFLWKHALDYPHGTGHGVGHYLSVHEGPQSISKHNNFPIEPGMVLSIEPGYYIPGKYGIRIENIVFVREVDEKKNFLQFEALTLAPIPFNLINEILLSTDEKKWLLKYHKRVYDALSPFLDKNAKNHLEKYLDYYSAMLII
jgi:Xaa-Pro aminopeptidase